MCILAIETAIMNRGSVALLNDKGKIVEEGYERHEDYKDRLWPAIDKVLKLSGLGIEKVRVITVSQGPGSFTGLRVGISVAKTLALSLKKPLLGISTLEILAEGLRNDGMENIKLVIPVLDAKKKLVYAAIFRNKENGSGLKRETADLVLTIEELCRMIKEPAVFLGEGAEIYEDIISRELGSLARFVSGVF